MKRYAPLLVAILLAADKPGDDLKKIEGTWTLVRGEMEGQDIPQGIVKNASLTIEGDKHNVKVGNDTLIGTHKMDSARKTIESTDTEGPFKDKTILGIYRLKGDEFTVCFALPDKERPTEFTTKSGTGHVLHVWKREKK